jgi:hypothetical protein
VADNIDAGDTKSYLSSIAEGLGPNDKVAMYKTEQSNILATYYYAEGDTYSHGTYGLNTRLYMWLFSMASKQNDR